MLTTKQIRDYTIERYARLKLYYKVDLLISLSDD